MADVNKFNVDGTIVNVEDATARKPAFTEASTRANIASGESLSTLFGKIKKFFTDLKTVAFTGSYTDLTDKPTIPTVNNATLTIQKNGTNVQTFTANASANKTANITVPTKVSELTNDSGYTTNTGTVTQVKVGTTAHDPSSGVVSLPAYPTVNNATLTIQKNGTNVQTFTANASANKTANITVPTKVSELTNDSGYTTNTGTVTQVKVGTTAYNPSSGVVSLPAYPTVNNATLTIQKNGTNVATFTANQSSNATANITVPTVNNNLTSTSTSTALTANMGNTLAKLIGNLETASKYSKAYVAGAIFVYNNKIYQTTTNVTTNTTITVNTNCKEIGSVGQLLSLQFTGWEDATKPSGITGTAKFKVVGNVVHLIFDITATSNKTASTAVLTGIPQASISTNQFALKCYADGTNRSLGVVYPSSTSFYADGLTVGSACRVFGSIIYPTL